MTSATINIPFDFACTRRYANKHNSRGLWRRNCIKWVLKASVPSM